MTIMLMLMFYQTHILHLHFQLYILINNKLMEHMRSEHIYNTRQWRKSILFKSLFTQRQ